MNGLISIVLPVYNGDRFLRESIDSVISQTYTNWELLILDDCSTDQTPVIAQEYQERDSRIHYHRNEKNLKLPGNLNRGFSLAKGDLLTWTSDDNRFRPNALALMADTLRQRNVDLVYASYQVIDEEDRPIRVQKAEADARSHILGGNSVGACFLYTRRVYETVGDYDTDLFLVEDQDYWQRILMKFPACHIEEILYDYRWHDSSLTSTKNLVRFGQVCERMLLKNRPGFGKLSLEAKCGYYAALSRARANQGLKNPYAFQTFCTKWACRIVSKVKK